MDIDHRLVDPLVAHPRLQTPRTHAEQRGVCPERVTQPVRLLRRAATGFYGIGFEGEYTYFSPRCNGACPPLGWNADVD
jgi:hypothetical protein